MNMAGNVLDVDPSIIEGRLRIKELDIEEEEFNKLFNGISKPQIYEGVGKPQGQEGMDDKTPWKIVKPLPGICVKFYTIEGDKSFVNVCHTQDIPIPKEVNNDELITILDSQDPTSYRIPMSISDPHTEKDKSGNLTKAYDVAVHSSLIPKIESNNLFQMFFMSVTLEAIQQKYGIKVNLTQETPYIIMKNRKVLGPLRAHRIQQRDVKPPPSPLIEEVSSPASQTTNRSHDHKLKLEKHPADGDPEFLLARVKIKALSEKDVLLDIGEDRLILTAVKKNQSFVDIFLPYNIDQENASAEYSRFDQELKIRMPVLK